MSAKSDDDKEVVIEGNGATSVVMIHGWPDTHRLWDGTVAALKGQYRCVRFDLPGFAPGHPRRAYSVDEVVEAIHRVVVEACPDQRVCLLLHDWGCFYGYAFAMQYPQLVERVIGVDIGDAGSRSHRKELGILSKFILISYQLWLAIAWRIGGMLGNALARIASRLLLCPVDPHSVTAQMCYPYAVVWFGVAGGAKKSRKFEPDCPMLYLYGKRKPFMFHSSEWINNVASRPHSRVLGFQTGHWPMLGQKREFNDAVLDWLAETQQ